MSYIVFDTGISSCSFVVHSLSNSIQCLYKISQHKDYVVITLLSSCISISILPLLSIFQRALFKDNDNETP